MAAPPWVPYRLVVTDACGVLWVGGYVNLAGSVPVVGYSCGDICRGLVTWCRRFPATYVS